MNHYSGKKSFARIRAEQRKELGREPGRVETFMKSHTPKENGATRSQITTTVIGQLREKLTEIPPDSYDTTKEDDVLSQVLGPEKNGRIRTYGLGVLQSDILGTNPSRRACRREALMYKDKVEQLLATNEQLQANNEQLEARLARMEQLVLNRSDRNVPYHERSSSDTSNGRATTPRCNNRSDQGSRGRTIDKSFSNASYGRENSIGHAQSFTTARYTTRSIKEREFVCLKSIINPGVVVAKGIVCSIDASTIIGHEKLGENWREVLVEMVLNADERLIRSYEIFETIGDSIGATIAWPMSLVVADDD